MPSKKRPSAADEVIATNRSRGRGRGQISRTGRDVASRVGQHPKTKGNAAGYLDDKSGGNDHIVAPPIENVPAGPSETQERKIVRGAEVDAELEKNSACIGPGTRATVLFHEPFFDAAVISLGIGGSEMEESNTTTSELLYFVSEAEDQQVEFELRGKGCSQRLSKGGEILIPVGAKYVLRNLSTHVNAKLIAIVPRVVS